MTATRLNRLWITEKPAMAKALAAGLSLTYGVEVVNAKEGGRDGCYRLSNGDAVGFFFGHMVELAPPEAYLTEEQNKGDVFSYLPLFPAKFIRQPKSERGKDGKIRTDRAGKPLPFPQFTKMAELALGAKEIVNAGDTDREGQLIVDEFLEFIGLDPRGGSKPVWRLALQNPDEAEIKKLVLAGLEKNSDDRWVRKSVAAYARQTGDWAVGMTGSRAFRQVTGYSKMAVGRVQTPTLAIVVERERAIINFKPVDYFVPVITLTDGTKMRWFRRQGAEGTPGFDREGRIISEAVARQIVSAIQGQNNGEISLAEAEKKYQPPPLPFSLGTLQSTASRRYGMSLKEVTDAAQALYERHKMITYVGTDCQYLPTSMLKDAAHTIKGLSEMYRREAIGANLDIVSKAWNDSKTDEHFAIAPTGKIASGLNQAEKNVFEAVTRRFLAQFYPNHEFVKMRLQATFGRDEFRANDKAVTRNGWKDAEYGADGDATGEELDAETMGDDEKDQARQRGAVE